MARPGVGGPEEAGYHAGSGSDDENQASGDGPSWGEEGTDV